MLSIHILPEIDNYNTIPKQDTITFNLHDCSMELIIKDNCGKDRELDLSKEDAIKLAETILFHFT